MTDVVDVGQYIYNKLGWIDSWRLQKLTYYVEAWSLAWDGHSAFDNDFEAWPDGPVSRKLYRENKYGAGMMGSKIPGADADALSDRTRAIVDAVLSRYGSMTKKELIDRTHAEDPWIEARGGLPPEASSTSRLSERTMRRYYARQAILDGVGTPTPPDAVATPCAPSQETLALAAKEAERWSHTLRWLSTR